MNGIALTNCSIDLYFNLQKSRLKCKKIDPIFNYTSRFIKLEEHYSKNLFATVS